MLCHASTVTLCYAFGECYKGHPSQFQPTVPSHLVGLLLQVDEVFIHLEEGLEVVEVLQHHRVFGVSLQEGVSCRHSLFKVVPLQVQAEQGHEISFPSCK